MINCKFDYYKINGTRYIEDYTLLNRACVHGAINQINCLMERGVSNLMHEYKHFLRDGPTNCIGDLQSFLRNLELHQEDKEDQRYKDRKEAIELLIKRFEQYEEDIKKPNKICRNI
jgi:hypothetical protein